MRFRLAFLVGLLPLLVLDAACGDSSTAAADASVDAQAPDTTSQPDAPVGLAVLGSYAHSIDSVSMTVIHEGPQLSRPTDLAFHPTRKTELWIVNQGDNSVALVQNPGTANQKTGKASGAGGQHFLARPSSLAFGANGNFATSHETDQPTQQTTPADFMGPTLWSSDPAIFNAGHAGHLDMLHNSPLGMGIAWEKDNVFWVFDGMHSAVARYAFNSDHGPGGADHSDGEVGRYVEGKVKRVADVPSHMMLDDKTGLLYIADTGNNRIATLDTKSGTPGAAILPNYDGTTQRRVDDATLTTLVDGAKAGLKKPSGLELHDGLIFITDNETATIYAFTTDGVVVDWLETGLPAGALMGLTFDDKGALFIVDAVGERILRITSK
ncbi:MAG: hypothetical protein KC503_00330 [Myxococcales bacterium]|nr:hypothetical protein [Myxococcales bacterium]